MTLWLMVGEENQKQATPPPVVELPLVMVKPRKAT